MNYVFIKNFDLRFTRYKNFKIKPGLAVLLLVFSAAVCFSQPTITSFAPASGAPGTTVTITGTNFSATPANNIVYFGATRTTVATATTTQLTAQVPLGATQQPITVTVGGLTAYSSDAFIPTFAGSGTVDATSFAARVSFATGVDPAYVTTGDLDGNGSPDIATPNNGSITTASFFRNTSSAGTISYTAKDDLTVGSNPISSAMGDLDGDGKLDVVVVNYTTSNLTLMRNTSTVGTISFAASVTLGTPSNPYDAAISDLDGDGKSDLIIANYTGSSISVFRNTSTVGSFSFAARQDFTLPENAVSVAVGDLNEDGKSDVAVASFFSSTNKVTVFKNTSTSGAITFDPKVDFVAASTPRCVRIGDLDNDGKPELAVANSGSNSLSVFRNTTSAGTISFATRQDFTTGTGPFSVAIGDIDGDTKPDLAAVNFSSNTVSVFKNNSTTGSVVLASKVDFATSNQPRGVLISDQDSDGKNDLVVVAFASDAFSVLRNTTKLSQSITFGALPTKTYGDANFNLSATSSSGLTVTYTSSNTSVAAFAGSLLTIIGAGTATITASQAGNASYAPAPNVVQTFTVNPDNQTITFGSLTGKSFGDASFALGATASSGLTVSYASSNTAVATVSGNTVTVVGVGSTTITASQAGNTNYNAATSVQQTLTVSKANQTITFGAVPNKLFTDAPFNLTATSSSGLAVTYSSSNTGVATVSGSTVTIVGVGSTTITASQSGNGNYNAAAAVPQTLTVNKGNQSITFGSFPAKVFGDAPFAIGATTSSGLAITYASSNTAVATIAAGTITIVGAGTSIITALQNGNANYNAATNVSQTLTVGQASQTITFGALPAKSFGDAPFTLSATASSALPVTYASSNSSVATVSGNTVTVVGVGSAIITASQVGNTNFAAAPNVQQTLTVGKGAQTITFGALPTKTFGDTPFTVSATASSGLAVGFGTSNSGVATVSGNTITITGAGSVVISAFQNGNGNYNSAPPVQQTLTVNKKAQTITFNSLPVKTMGDAPFTISSTASSGLPVSFTSDNSSVATVSGNVITIVGGGTATITAEQAGDTNFEAATGVPQTLTVNKANQSITFGALAPRLAGESFTLTASSSSGLALSYSSSNTNVATISGDVVSVVGIGTTTITASQSGNASYNPATNVQQLLTVSKGPQTITFNALQNKTYGDAAFALNASSSANLAVVYSSSNPNVAKVSGDLVTIVGTGSTSITASQPGDANFDAATDVSQTLTVVKADQTITFNAPPNKALGDAPFDLAAVSSSGLAVSYTSSNLSVATIAGKTVTIVGVGTTTITATQTGDSNYNAADPVTQTLEVGKISQSITFAALADKTLGDAPFTLTATASSSLPATFSSTSNKISISGAQVTIQSAGRVTITAAQAGNSNYNAAPSVERSFCINPAKPTIAVTNDNTATPTLTSSATAGNQWYFNGAIIPGATSNTYAATQAGVYKVKTTADDCASEFSNDQVLFVTGDLKSVAAVSISLYPNPAAEWLIVKLGDLRGQKDVSLVDMNGKQLDKQTTTNDETRFNVSAYRQGMYWVQVQMGGVRRVLRFVKE